MEQHKKSEPKLLPLFESLFNNIETACDEGPVACETPDKRHMSLFDEMNTMSSGRERSTAVLAQSRSIEALKDDINKFRRYRNGRPTHGDFIKSKVQFRLNTAESFCSDERLAVKSSESLRRRIHRIEEMLKVRDTDGSSYITANNFSTLNPTTKPSSSKQALYLNIYRSKVANSRLSLNSTVQSK